MRSRVDTIKAVKAQEAAEKERQRKLAAFKTSPSADASESASASQPTSAPQTPSKGYTGLLVQIVAVSILVIGIIYGANEAMIILLK